MLISCNSKNATIEGFEIVGTIEMNSQGEVVGDLSNAQPGDVLAGWRLGGNSNMSELLIQILMRLLV